MTGTLADLMSKAYTVFGALWQAIAQRATLNAAAIAPKGDALLFSILVSLLVIFARIPRRTEAGNGFRFFRDLRVRLYLLPCHRDIVDQNNG
jgi:hypothetical protein